MAKLTDEIRRIFENQLALIATADKDGNPNVGPKGSMHILDDETLVYSEGTGEKTFRNLKENPKVAVLAVDKEQADGYQIKGTAELLDSGDIFQYMAKRQAERGRPVPKYVVKIRAEEIYSVKPGRPAHNTR